MGPIDLARSTYNQIIGDTPVIKTELVEYARKGIRTENPDWSEEGVEAELARELGVKVGKNGINPLEASILNLWDASEDYANSFWQQWIWADLDD